MRPKQGSKPGSDDAFGAEAERGNCEAGAGRVGLGRISGLHGVRGWLKVYSYTEPREHIIDFDAWLIEQGGEAHRVEVEAGRSSGKQVIAKLRGIDDREAARAWIGAEILVERSTLPVCEPGEYYWVDLEGLEVRNKAGERLGRVDHVMATGANDVLVLSGPEAHMIPFAAPILQRVDLPGGVIVVDWERSFWEQ
ncbi:MAG TPA: ribosome maturation factor RimM [Gammaproteobacteria bacterium]|nr:ribosome maturation factor RimM [Gammaproteobacteria bacterium]